MSFSTFIKLVFLLSIALTCSLASSRVDAGDKLNIVGKLQRVDCSMVVNDDALGSVCIEATFINTSNRNICIHDDSVPHDGELKTNTFRVFEDLSAKRKAYLGLEEHGVWGSKKVAKLVRLMQPGATLEFIVDLSRYYGVKDGSKLRLRFAAPAHYCDEYDDEQSRYGGALKAVLDEK